jgi:8-oxo-dGTP pyrophosphatase MutT (NUDIX family)
VLLAGARDIVQSDAMRLVGREGRASERFVRLSQLRKLCECEQVAAVCYRVRGLSIEFLLVRTRGAGRWTFPKGSAELGLTHAQAAALEAFEEAGVHGRIEEASFARYVCQSKKELAVNAYLCEVLRLSPPQESKRDRTWFSVVEARQRLREGRKNDGGAEFARVIDRAVVRIQKLRGRIGVVDDRPRQNRPQQDRAQQDRPQADRPQQDRPRFDAPQKDALQRVRFDFAEAYGRPSFMPQVRQRLNDMRRSYVPIVDVHSREVLQCEVLEVGSAREKKPKVLGTGTKSG